ncbi:hydrolase TatD, partial [Pseudomonas sp. TKO26]|uniref:TatD family hydrolase n=1 Tax=unclassified Pseudomonas TaxID=196821 RepID=UPI000D8B34A3
IHPRSLVEDGVVAVGEIGYDDITPEDDRFLAAQLELAKQYNLPVLVHTPHRDKIGGTKRTLAAIREVGIAEHLEIIDHLNELTMPLVLESDCWLGQSIYPNTKRSEQRMVALLQSDGTENMVVDRA